MSDFIAKRSVLNFFQKCITKNVKIAVTEAAFTCSKLTIETLKQGVKYIQSSL